MSQENSTLKAFMMGAGAALAGVALDRLFRTLSAESIRQVAWAVADAHRMVTGKPQEKVAVRLDAVPEEGYALEDTLPPPASNSRSIFRAGAPSPPYVPPNGVIPVTEDEATLLEAQAIMARIEQGEDVFSPTMLEV